MNGVKVAFGNIGTTVEAAPCFGPPSRALWLSSGEGRDAVT